MYAQQHAINRSTIAVELFLFSEFRFDGAELELPADEPPPLPLIFSLAIDLCQQAWKYYKRVYWALALDILKQNIQIQV